MMLSKILNAFNNITFLQTRQDETVKKESYQENGEIKRACYKRYSEVKGIINTYYIIINAQINIH